MIEKLKQLRTSKGYTCQQMADKMNLTKGTYSKKENGKIKITLSDAKKISQIFNHSVDDIFFSNKNFAQIEENNND